MLADRCSRCGASARGTSARTRTPTNPRAERTNLDSDTYYRALRQSGVVQRLLTRPAPLGPTDQVRQLVDGYVAGYNRYLRRHRRREPARSDLPGRPGSRRSPRWTCGPTSTTSPARTAARAQAGHRGGRAAHRSAPARTARSSAVRRLGRHRQQRLGARQGRHHGHDGMLLANPHFPWTGDGRFYQVQLTIPGVSTSPARSLYGTPVVEIGHTMVSPGRTPCPSPSATPSTSWRWRRATDQLPGRRQAGADDQPDRARSAPARTAAAVSRTLYDSRSAR